MEIHQKAAVRTSNSTDVLSNLKDATDYHQSKMKKNLHHGSGIIHPNYNSNEQISYTIPVTVCVEKYQQKTVLTLILRRSRTGTVWFYTSNSNKRAA